VKRFRHGLVLGKFYPPHAGHHFVVSTAAAQCDRVTVLVCFASTESIPLDLRVAWMREAHADQGINVIGLVDDLPNDFNDPVLWDAHTRLIEDALPAPVDAVFASEEYAVELARRLNAQHVSVDPARTMQPVSGTAVRRDPAAYWRFLSPAVRAYFTKRVVVCGAESTGKTTLALALATHFESLCVPEYGRDYAEQKFRQSGLARIEDLPWRSEEFAVIATRQRELENARAREGSQILICDTDPLSTLIWHERYLGYHSAAVEEVVLQSPHHLWLLTHHDDVPFEQDGWRDGENIRSWMTGRFLSELTARALPFVHIRGTREVRLRHAIQAIEDLGR
jgi:HTH-type transcriptional repressor of NAD biosynthesis genes